MGRYHRFASITVGLAMSLVPALGQSVYCGFEVRVNTPSGKSASRVPVLLVGTHHTSLFETETDENGVARICDVPLETVNIVVGFDICGSVVVRNLAASWPTTMNIFVTYAKRFCEVAPRINVQVLLRVEDEAGHPVAGAHFERTAGAVAETSKSDVFGRLYLLVTRGSVVEGRVVKGKKSSERISLQVVDRLERRLVVHGL